MVQIRQAKTSTQSQTRAQPSLSKRTHLGGLVHCWAGMVLVVISTVPAVTQAQATPPELVFLETFQDGATNWQPTDPSAWSVVAEESKQNGTSQPTKNKVYSLNKKRSNYKPPHRSPLNISLRKDKTLGDFVLTARLRSTHKDYNHRDLCLFFGYQDPAHFYYVHLGKRTDNHANQIFIVNGAPRTKISTKTTNGTPWTDNWHQVKIVRNVETGLVQVFFDNMETPVMQATDQTFTWGQVGIGSFDDTGHFDDIKVIGTTVSPPQ